MYTKRVNIVVLSSDAYLYGIGSDFGAKLMSNCVFTFVYFI